MLWVICMIDHHKEDRNKLCPAKLEEEYGKTIENYFGYAVEWLERYKLIKPGYLILTEKGQLVADNWKTVRNKIFSLPAHSE